MNPAGLVIGLLIMMLCLFLAQAAPVYFTSLTSQALDLLKLFLLMFGIAALVVGGMSK